MRRWIVGLVIGICCLAFSTGAGIDKGPVRCGSEIMQGGMVCETTKNGVTKEKTYSEMVEDSESGRQKFEAYGRWIFLGVGSVLTGLSGYKIFAARRARKRAATEPAGAAAFPTGAAAVPAGAAAFPAGAAPFPGQQQQPAPVPGAAYPPPQEWPRQQAYPQQAWPQQQAFPQQQAWPQQPGQFEPSHSSTAGPGGPVAQQQVSEVEPDSLDQAIATLAAWMNYEINPQWLPQWHHGTYEEWRSFASPAGYTNTVYLVHNGTVYPFAPSLQSPQDAIQSARALRNR